MTSSESKRVRASKPKARTGCKTCKTRKVKCDEAKPSCERCVRFGVCCQGYEEPCLTRTTKSRVALKEILPRIGYHQIPLSPLLGAVSSATFFEDDREYSYFLSFQEEVAPNIFGFFDRNLYNDVILQTSWLEPAFHRLVASIGALNKASKLRELDAPKHEISSHQQYAFRNYGRALNGVQRLISTDQHRDNTRTALIASLLIYCFESLQGDIYSATAHLESALKVVQKELACTGRRYDHVSNTSSTPALENGLLSAFVRLDNALLARPESSKAEYRGWRNVRPRILDINFQDGICEVPNRFDTMDEARSYLEYCQYCILPMLSYDFAVLLNTSLQPVLLDRNTKEMYRTMYSQLRQWDLAFNPLYTETIAAKDNENFVSAAILRIRALSVSLAVQQLSTDRTRPYNFNIPHSREIVNLSRVVADDPKFSKSFVWDCGIIPSLSIVVSLGGNIDIRKEALQILMEVVPRREGPWDSMTVVKFGVAALQMQEACLGMRPV